LFPLLFLKVPKNPLANEEAMFDFGEFLRNEMKDDFGRNCLAWEIRVI
jgi:hypothetical protein